MINGSLAASSFAALRVVRAKAVTQHCFDSGGCRCHFGLVCYLG